MLRRILWFATAYTLVIIVHETAHALTAYALGLETTRYQFWVNINSANRATIAGRSAYGVAGHAASARCTAWSCPASSSSAWLAGLNVPGERHAKEQPMKILRCLT